ncbi:MAG TPA: hypothetical protein VGE47_04055, partial [Burkholderiaceae bacterium]
MKRITLTLAALALVPALALAQSNINTKAKIDPKNNKVSRPVVDKPKPVLMTREALRACIEKDEANKAEAEAVRTAQAAWKAEHESLLKEKAALTLLAEDITKRTESALAERDALNKINDELKDPKLDKAVALAKTKEYNERAGVLREVIDK